MDEGQVVIHQDDRPLGPGSGAGGVKQVARLAGDETHGPGPLYRVDGPAGDGFPVREGGGHLGQRLPQGMPKDHSQLLPGHLVVGTEPAVIIAGDDPLAVQRRHIGVKPVPLPHIGKGGLIVRRDLNPISRKGGLNHQTRRHEPGRCPTHRVFILPHLKIRFLPHISLVFLTKFLINYLTYSSYFAILF